MASLNGKWSYRSFRGGLNDTPRQLAVPWSPPGELEATTDGSGKVTGTLTFRPPGVTLNVTGAVTPASADGRIPEGVELTGEMTREGVTSVSKIRGFFIPGSDHVVGTVFAEKNDLGKQPDGTWGPFVLFPARPK